MNIKFKNVKAQYFMSYENLDIDLDNQGFCLISGINNYSKDNASSNGAGKCFGKGTQVLMSDGTIKNVEDIKVGDLVMGWNGEPRKVLETHKGIGKLYKIYGLSYNNENYSYVCNENHLLCLKETNGKNKSDKDIFLNVDELSKLSFTKRRAYNQYIVGIDHFNRETQELPLDPYFLGVWLGDGTATKPEITTMDEEIVETCKEIANKYNLTITEHKKDGGKATTYTLVGAKGKENPITKILRELNVWNNKHIPDIYLYSSYENRLKLLCGLLDTDGGKEKGYSLSITQANKRLAYQIVFLARSLGFKTTIHTRRVKAYLYKDYYRITINGETYKIPLRVKHKIVKPFKAQRPHTIGKNIEYLGVGDYYGFQIEGDGKFLLANFMVVHNSTIFNAISWALTGETMQGVKSNVANINLNQGCYVDLTFYVDDDLYEVVRYKDYENVGTNLKIYINNVDKSGTTFKKSESLLKEYLPNLTSTLLGSVILLEQGLPYKFTSNTPSARKEILEQLSNTDNMIEDIKGRINTRQDKLNQDLRVNEDSLLTATTNINNYQNQLDEQNKKLEELNKETNLDEQISILKNEIEKLTKETGELEISKKSLEEKLSSSQQDLDKLKEEKNVKINNLKEEYNKKLTELTLKINDLNNSIQSLDKEIKKLKDIKDVCPTCHQKIQGVVKPDTTKQEEERKNLKTQLEPLKSLVEKQKEEFDINNATIEKDFSKSLEMSSKNIEETKKKINKADLRLKEIESKELSLTKSLLDLESKKENYESNLKSTNDKIENLTKKIEKLSKEKEKEENSIEKINNSLEVVKKISTLTSRDLRGYLLSGIIDYINTIAKKYSIIICGNDDLNFVLNGNNIDITFSKKNYENLSGGEKQKVDLIIQFAIREFLLNYLDFSSNILVLDEITDNLDMKGCEKVIEFITSELKDVESVFLISHKAKELNLPVDKEIIIEKDKNGVSRIIRK